MNIHILQHVPFEGAGSIEAWALAQGHTLTTTRFYAQEPFPALATFDLLVIMGGPMSIHDEHLYSWLKGEKWFARQVIDSGRPVLGVCLGAQLLAEVLGGEVYPGKQKEIGWFPIVLDEGFILHPLGAQLAPRPTVFHWHGETFTLPPGAQRIATSAACDNQGFIYRDQVIALQFHLETTPESAQSIVEHCGDELVDAPYIQSAEAILGNSDHYSAINSTMRQMLEYLEVQVGQSRG
ncbi:MAG: type 1 glutamine amidotransferase [Gammaproteobacteria bacterium]|nr:type 1 glutamine amidotransferase [Gammaproteobacteria bacterium]